MQIDSQQTHVGKLYVCFLPSQISQIRPLIETFHEVIEAQYPIKDKTAPYFIFMPEMNFLFIPVSNIKHFLIQDVINLAIQVEQLEIHYQFQEYDIHFDLLQKYLLADHISMIETAIHNKFKIKQNQQLDTTHLNLLPKSVVERTLCLINSDEVEMYEYVPLTADKLFLYIVKDNEVNFAMLNSILSLNYGVVFIIYKVSVTQSRKRIAMNGLNILTNENNYHNICYDALTYAKQYRLQTILIQSTHIKNTPQSKAHVMMIEHNKIDFLAQLVNDQFEVEYKYHKPIRNDNHIDLTRYQEQYKQSIDKKLLSITFRDYPNNEAIFTYIFRKLMESLD